MVGLIAQWQSIAQVCGPSLCTQNSIMNAIAAHKDELEKLLENLSGDIPLSGITFVGLLDAYITRLDANCSDIRARVNPPPAQINGELHMEPTLTQNCALYFAQHKTSKPRIAPFQRFRVAVSRRALASRRQLTNDELFRRLPLHRDNGR
jgi:hypothetical protein